MPSSSWQARALLADCLQRNACSSDGVGGSSCCGHGCGTGRPASARKILRHSPFKQLVYVTISATGVESDSSLWQAVRGPTGDCRSGWSGGCSSALACRACKVCCCTLVTRAAMTGMMWARCEASAQKWVVAGGNRVKYRVASEWTFDAIPNADPVQMSSGAERPTPILCCGGGTPHKPPILRPGRLRAARGHGVRPVPHRPGEHEHAGQ